MSDPTQAPKETAELIHFFCAFGKAAADAYGDDHRISFLEGVGMLSMTKGAVTAFVGMDKIPRELSDLVPEQARELTEIVASYFGKMLPHQHRVILESMLACIPAVVNLLQTIRNSAALAAEYPGAAPRALPV